MRNRRAPDICAIWIDAENGKGHLVRSRRSWRHDFLAGQELVADIRRRKDEPVRPVNR